MDLYKELGVEKTATTEEIKKAYKRLAMKHHPDRGGDSEKLSQINAAYTVLKDPKKRAEYDNPMRGQGFGGFRSSGPDMNSVFEEMFRRGGFHTNVHSNSFRQNQTLRMKTVLSLKECFTGKQFTASFTLPSGKVEEIDVNIPAGVTDGDVIRVAGMGDDRFSDMPRGDIHLVVQIKPEPGWDIHGHDLLTSKTVNIFDLAIGTNVMLRTINGKQIKLKIPPGTQPGKVMSINGYGLPYPNRNSAGNLHVKINTFVPEIVKEELVKKTEDLRDEISQVP